MSSTLTFITHNINDLYVCITIQYITQSESKSRLSVRNNKYYIKRICKPDNNIKHEWVLQTKLNNHHKCTSSYKDTVPVSST